MPEHRSPAPGAEPTRVHAPQLGPGEVAHRQEWLSLLFDAVPVLLVVWEPDLARFTLNRVAQEVLGRTNEDVAAGGFFEGVYPDPAVRARAAAFMRDLEPGWREFTATRPDGRTVSIDWANFTLGDQARVGIGIHGTREALQRSERLYRAIGESIDYGVWVCAPDGRNTYASKSFLDLVGMTQQQCSDFGWGDVLHPDDAPRTIAAWKECVRTGGTWDIEHRFRGVDGAWHHVLARGAPVKDEHGQVLCWAGINLDIDRLKQTEEALRASEATLREADRRKNEFLAVLSHELRNPLGPIQNSIYLLDRVSPGGEAARRALAVIDRQTRQLTRLVDDLLDVNRISTGKMQLRRVTLDVVDLLRRTVDDHLALFLERQVDLDTAWPCEPLWIDADPARISQAVANLLQNAAKFTAPHGRVTLSVTAGASEARIVVRDSGVGIDPDLLARIFEPFTQADRTLDRSGSGLGLGLALVAGITQLHGGTVSVSSDGPGRGAEFTIVLPLVAPAPVRADASGVPQRASARRILVVEDNVDSADSLQALLELFGHAVDVAYSGSAGIERFHAAPYDVVICDIGLPGLSGYEVARRLRMAERGARRSVLIALTGYGSEDEVQRAHEAGFDAHLTKPVNLDVLRQLLDRR